MNAALAAKPLEDLVALYGPMRPITHHAMVSLPIPREQGEAYAFNILGGKRVRESVINGTNGTADLFIRLVEYIEPVTLATRYAIDYWSVVAYWSSDHSVRAVAELFYEDAVRREFARPTLTLSLERFSRGLASFYDVTDVI